MKYIHLYILIATFCYNSIAFANVQSYDPMTGNYTVDRFGTNFDDDAENKESKLSEIFFPEPKRYFEMPSEPKGLNGTLPFNAQY